MAQLELLVQPVLQELQAQQERQVQVAQQEQLAVQGQQATLVKQALQALLVLQVQMVRQELQGLQGQQDCIKLLFSYIVEQHQQNQVCLQHIHFLLGNYPQYHLVGQETSLQQMVIHVMLLLPPLLVIQIALQFRLMLGLRQRF